VADCQATELSEITRASPAAGTLAANSGLNAGTSNAIATPPQKASTYSGQTSESPLAASSASRSATAIAAADAQAATSRRSWRAAAAPAGRATQTARRRYSE